jgi:hypothetical protein
MVERDDIVIVIPVLVVILIIACIPVYILGYNKIGGILIGLTLALLFCGFLYAAYSR